MTYYKTNIAAIYGIDIRTLHKRLDAAQIQKKIPHIKNHRATLNEGDFEKIVMALGGKPNEIKRYVKYKKDKKKARQRLAS